MVVTAALTLAPSVFKPVDVVAMVAAALFARKCGK